MGEPSKQRWYFGGKLMPDKTRIGDANIPSGHVVQCIVNEKTTADKSKSKSSKKSTKD